MATGSGPAPTTVWRLYENGKWKSFGVADGLAHRAVLSLALDKRTHDLWIGTMGGLSRYSAGRFDTFTQLTSGLPNDVVYGVSVYWRLRVGGHRRRRRALEYPHHQWNLYNERNTPMYEIWTYSVTRGRGQGLLRGMGRRSAGIRREDRPVEGLQRSRRRKRDRTVQGPGIDSRDHDFGQLREQASCGWPLTSARRRYDGRNWRNFLDKDSGLPSNFLNQVKTVDGTRTWFSTDKGLAYYDGETLGDLSSGAGHTQAGDAGARHERHSDARARENRRRRITTPSRSIFRTTIFGWLPPRGSATEFVFYPETIGLMNTH